VLLIHTGTRVYVPWYSGVPPVPGGTTRIPSPASPLAAQTNFFHIAIFLRTNNLFVEFLMLFVYHVPSCRQSALATFYVFLQQCQFRKPKTLHNNRVKALYGSVEVVRRLRHAVVN
jgi:hypothetical protein